VRFEADLQIEIDGTVVAVGSDDGTLVVTASDLRPVLASLRTYGPMPAKALRRAAAQLDASGATVRVDTPSARVLTIGREARPQLLTRLIGISHVRVESIPSAVAAIRPKKIVLIAAAILAAAGGLAVGRLVRRS